MTSALASFGTLLKLGNGVTTTAETFTTIAEVKDISGPGMSLNTADVTAHDGSGWREHVATLLDAGEVSFDVNYVPTNATHNNTAGLIKMMTSRALRNYQLVFPGPTTWTFAAFVTGFEPGSPVDGALTASVSMRISGQPTLV